jgi:hypothetical protein
MTDADFLIREERLTSCVFRIGTQDGGSVWGVHEHARMDPICLSDTCARPQRAGGK